MHLKSLTLKGFKSFASATTLKFEPGICAVVGPNGSGKSNVVDALAWVMGEQGAKTLRGGKMQDVIFAGAGDRKPLGRAEVTLTIDNSDGKLPIDYAEVSVTRRMFRDGASEYEINGAKARLMDIQELLSDSGIGREMHIIVGQGKLSDILESRPEERRAYIEEAAGVLKHRRRREKAQRKLTGMQANLDRLRDVTDELGRQLKPLARQAQAARRAASVQAELRDARLRLAGARVVQVRETLEAKSAAQARAASQRTELEGQVAQAQGRHDAASARDAELSPLVDQANELWIRLSTLAERISATARIAQERGRAAQEDAGYQGPDPAELEAEAEAAWEEVAALEEESEIAAERLESVSEEVAARSEQLRQAEAEYAALVKAVAHRREGLVRLIATEESLAAREQTATVQVERAQQRVEQMVQRAGAARAEADAAQDAVADAAAGGAEVERACEQAHREAQGARRRLEELETQQRERERELYSLQARRDTLRQAVAGPSLEDVVAVETSPLSAHVRVPAGLEVALASALGPHADAVALTMDEGVLTQLREGNVARTALVDVTADPTPWHLDASLPAGAEWLVDKVSADAAVCGAISALLADVVVVPDAQDARRLVADDPRLRAVTPRGDLFGRGWAVVGSGAPSAVEVEARLAQTEAAIVPAQEAVDAAAGTLEGARQAADQAQVSLAEATAARRDHEARVGEAQRVVQRVTRQCEADDAAVQRAEKERDALLAELDSARRELRAVREQLSQVEDSDDPAEVSTATRDSAVAALEQVRAMEVEARLSLRSAQDRAQQSTARAQGLARRAAQERQARQAHEAARARRIRQRELARVVESCANDLAARVDLRIAHAAEQRDSLTTQRREVARVLSQARDEVHTARTHLDRATTVAHEAQVALERARVHVEEAEAKVDEQLGLSVADLLADYTPGPDFDRAAEEKRLAQARRDLSALGKVNPLALEEYKALEERYQFLSTQLADVEQAREDLRGVIEDVDAKILQLFTDAWRDVEAEFPRVFSTLFPGGEGRLVLTEPDDLLATGIELEARPPGKRVKRLSLLSGGEKSLTALALLVAIFRARPSPFYVMDEVEAALDDVNLRRLIHLFEQLRQDSQLIVITHQKPTMDVANVLYGVTMRGDGVTRVLSQRMSPGAAPPSVLI
ncbi:chromosome segregation protein SMC [Corynebacterium uberis]|uniref:chromosome segregation protein SMC n=1 Tax=Corynebacterium uberis TaxID=2883169 RepID=UPI001D0B687D|nr:chromosome segregation protein SMC [Corynebacterium uberis]UDL83900.1 chromosome segregation protein SMC [Corynebacterium uberis]